MGGTYNKLFLKIIIALSRTFPNAASVAFPKSCINVTFGTRDSRVLSAPMSLLYLAIGNSTLARGFWLTFVGHLSQIGKICAYVRHLLTFVSNGRFRFFLTYVKSYHNFLARDKRVLCTPRDETMIEVMNDHGVTRNEL